MKECRELQAALGRVAQQHVDLHVSTNEETTARTGVPNPGLRLIVLAVGACDGHPHFALATDIEQPVELETILVEAVRSVHDGRILSAGEG